MNAEQGNPSVLGANKNYIEPGKIINNTVKNVESTTAQVLGVATQIVASTASKSAETTSNVAGAVSNFVFENTIGKIIDQVKVLPHDQQEKIKKEICK